MQLARIPARFDAIGAGIESLVHRAILARGHDREVFEACVETAIVRLHDEWAMKCRSLVLDSASGGAVRKSGHRIPRSGVLLRGESPLEAIRRTWKTTGKTMPAVWEPRWYDPGEACRAAALLSVVNQPTILAALGAGTTPPVLRTVRNVVAHSLPSCWLRFRELTGNLGLPKDITAAEFATTLDGVSGQMYIQRWVEDLENALWAGVV